MDPSERFAYWREAVCDRFVDLDVHRLGESAFEGRVESHQIDRIRANRVGGTPMQVARTPRLVSRSSDAYFKVGLQLRGTGLLIQDGREAVLRPGQLAFYDSTRPFTFHYQDRFDLLVLQVPHPAIAARAPGLTLLTARPFSCDGPLGRLLAMCMREIGMASGGAADHAVADAAIELMAAAAATMQGRAPEDPRALLRTRVKQFVRDHLTDHDLSPETIARAHGVSVRYLHKIFEEDQATVWALVRQLRLERARRDLVDAASQHLTVAAIAHRWAFCDAAHFTRSFKAAYGDTPAAFRAQALT
ncbi:helix-turn-helix domain-containing protein [Nitriliruptor alkaliphilus]|uniref:AraC-like ligand-binding domain-containing protein n=1 Tax=Nitriliruptor alkaliphilus TaxID=427918 RepID=UPI0006960363|nr:helix-turn-helix domain-containing protein [Nitriliruptor alkaliphilus]